MSAIKLDHVPLLEGSKNYSEWAKSMQYALLAENLWTYVSEGTNLMKLLEFGIIKPVLSDKSKDAEITSARSFMVNDAKATRH
jgi:hypothetical protein